MFFLLRDLGKVEIGRSGLHGTESERKTGVKHRFKPHRAVVDWFKECKQEDQVAQ